jgi:hypothetical protein
VTCRPLGPFQSLNKFNALANVNGDHKKKVGKEERVQSWAAISGLSVTLFDWERKWEERSFLCAYPFNACTLLRKQMGSDVLC